MKKTLVLVVDRDDDFGVKGKVQTPVIGFEECSVAAMKLGIADPEDSDVNALYAAINIYNGILSEEGKNVEVALIGGDSRIGYRSDAAIVEELEEVLRMVSPERVILVGDGAEDEYVYPIISSRVTIDSVRKVYVKQAPGLEGTVYIISKILEDPAKRRRFLAPIGVIMALISMVYVMMTFISYTNDGAPLSNITTPLVFFLVGALIMFYGYSIPEWFSSRKEKWVKSIKKGSVSVTFILLAFLFMFLGVVVGYLSLGDVYIPSLTEGILWGTSNGLWFIIFAILIWQVGDLTDIYISTKKIKLSFIIGSINIVAIGLIVTGALDIVLAYFNMGVQNNTLFALELIGGIILALISALLQRHMVGAIKAAKKNKDAKTDAS